MFYNESEVQQIAGYARRDECLAPFAALLLAFVETINSHSDGWAYWGAGWRSAERFITLLDAMCSPYPARRQPVDIAALRKALSPMKSLLTRHRLPALDTSALPSAAQAAAH